MTTRKQHPASGEHAQAQAAARQAREAGALRENLRRRKAQAREREGEASSSAHSQPADTRVRDVVVSEHELAVMLMDGRTITVPLAWFPRLAQATPAQRSHWEVAGAGYGIHWPEVDEDLSTEGLLQGARAPKGSETWRPAG